MFGYVTSKNGSLLDCFRGHQSGIHSMAFSPNVLEFVSSSRDGTIKIWEFAAPKDNANQGPKRERCIKVSS